MRPRASSWWVLPIVCLGMFAAQRVMMAQCASQNNGVVGVGTVDHNTGERTIKVTLPSVAATNQGVYDAAVAALAAWNDEKSTTKIKFVGVSSGGDISFNNDAAAVAASGGFCAFSGPGNDVTYDNYLKSLGTDPTGTIGSRTKADILKRVFSHELGHVMNLSQAASDTNSIMAGASGGSSCEDAITNHPATHYDSGITSADATNANTCANKGGKIKDPDSGYAEDRQVGESDCWDSYWIVFWFTESEDGSWTVLEVEMNYLYTTCYPPPI